MADGEPEDLIALDVTAEDAGQRLDAWLPARIPGLSRAKAKKIIEAGAVLVDGRPGAPRAILKPGQAVTVDSSYTLPEGPRELKPVTVPLEILHEDEHVVVVNKPAGMSVHPGAGDTGPTLVEALLAHVGGRLGQSMDPDHHDPLARLRPGVVHRLDKETSGVIVCARTDTAHAALAKQFQDKTRLLREYLALLDGVLKPVEVDHTSWLGRDPAQRTRFRSLSDEELREHRARHGEGSANYWRMARSVFKREVVYADRLTLARVRLYTGRTHQIRLHARDLRLPVVGDQVYGRRLILPETFPEEAGKALAGLSRQMLHAWQLGFVHPRSGAAMRFVAPIPQDFRGILKLLQGLGDTPFAPMDLK